MAFLADLCGWVGAAMLLVAYAAVSFKRLVPASFAYQCLNALGSGLLIVNTVYHRAWPAACLNTIWAGIAFVASVRRPSLVPKP